MKGGIVLESKDEAKYGDIFNIFGYYIIKDTNGYNLLNNNGCIEMNRTINLYKGNLLAEIHPNNPLSRVLYPNHYEYGDRLVVYKEEIDEDICQKLVHSLDFRRKDV